MGRFKDAIGLRCPRCGRGKLFDKVGFFEMTVRCSSCDLKYERENGFFYGAMYISYGLNVGTFVVALVLFFLIEDQVDWRIFIGAYVLLTVLAVKYMFRLSRSLWLMVNVKYGGEKPK